MTLVEYVKEINAAYLEGKPIVSTDEYDKLTDNLERENNKMQTIDELMLNKKPGELKLIFDQCLTDKWFTPYYKTDDGWWYGTNQVGHSSYFHSDHKVWKLWTAPVVEEFIRISRNQLDYILFTHTDWDETRVDLIWDYLRSVGGSK